MPGNLEEKEKCLEKLNQMQKFLPFLDFMIEKIKKKNNISLESQLSKFQLLRSMITEKNRKYNWDAIVKVEDVIEKLISKLEFKEQYEKSKENLTEVIGHKAKMKTSVSIIPPSTANSSSPQEMTTDSKSGDLPTASVDFIMKTLKFSCGASKPAERGTEPLSNPSDPYHSLEKTMDTDLDKDLDGFDLTDCPNASETQSGTVLAGAVPKKSPSAEDFLALGRAAVQCRPSVIKKSCPTSSGGERTEKASDSQTVSAFSRNQINADERKNKSDCLESSDKSPVDKKSRKSKDASEKTPGKLNPVSTKSCKTFTLSEKPRSESVSSSCDINLKQKLKEKLSTDICEVYRVPGKSVGGSLRGLKDSKDIRAKTKEEESVNKSGKSSENGMQRLGSISQSMSSSERKESHRSHRDSSSGEKRRGKSKERESHRNSSSSSGKSDKKSDKSSRNGARKYHKTESGGDRTQERSDSKISKDDKRSSSKSEKNSYLHKLDDNELSDFVKENIKSLPYLAKLKPGELREALQSSLHCGLSFLDTDGISEISDDSFHDMEEAIEKKDSRGGSKDKPSRAPSSAKLGQEGKNAKSSSKSKKEFEVVDLVDDLEDVSMDESLDEDAYALKLIEETTIKTYPKKKKELPISNGVDRIDRVDIFEEVSSKEHFEMTKSSDSPSTPLESKNKPNRPESVTQLKPAKQVLGDSDNLSTSSALKEAPKPGNPPEEVPRVQRSNEVRADPRLNRSVSSHGSQDASQSLAKSPPKPLHINDPRRHSSSSEPKSYGEYKRMKLKEQEKASKDGQKNNFPGGKVAESQSFVEGEKPPEQNDTVSKQNNPRSLRTYEARKSSNPKQRKVPEQMDGKEKCEDPAKKDEDKVGKSVDEKRLLDSEELISPLEELYKNEEKPKTGRGYGIQNFKIPKKWSRNTREPSKSGKNDFEGIGARKVEGSQPKAKEASLEESYSKGTISGVNRVNAVESGLEENWDDSNSNVSKQFQANESSLEEDWDDSSSCVNKIKTKQVNESSLDENRDDRNSKTNNSKTTMVNDPSLHEKCVESNSNVSKQFQVNESSLDENWDDISSSANKIKMKQVNETSLDENRYESNSKVCNQLLLNKSNFDLKWYESNSDVSKQFQVNESSLEENRDDIANSSITKDISSKTSEKVESTTESAKTDISIKENNSETAERGNKTQQKDDTKESGSSVSEVLERVTEEPESKNESKIEKADESQKDAAAEQMVTESEVKTVAENVKKCEAQIAECDSSMEASPVNEQSGGRESASSSEKGTVLQKEEITQEFMEALIRKSFQSGEGKLLLAQVKLFEEFARKLNSKKLKTIQRIINSESDSSSSTSESSSEDDRKRKKSKKRKKKAKKSRKHKSFSSSSSEESESEETTEEESCDKRDGSRKKEGIGDGEERLMDTSTTSEESKQKSNESSSGGKAKGKKRRRNLEFGRHFSGRKAKRKQKQKKLLEKILNEAPKQDECNESGRNEGDNTTKDSEPKSRPKTKGKCKTELDRLHDDIRSMFISDGVVTATGKRMCRILKRTGGDMNSLDIVKESAKMVEEEKLKKMRTRSSQKNSVAGKDESRSRSQSLEKGTRAPQENEDPKLALEPRICLQRVDLDNFGYGIKISDDCISFRRMQGRNTAIRGVGTPEMSMRIPPKEYSSDTLAGGVFLARNKRKFQRLKDSKCKKGYMGKKLMDIVKNLPLKMAKMKHLKFCEGKTEKDGSRKMKNSLGKYYKGSAAEKREVTKADFSNVELLQYAFEKKRKVYTCKLCLYVTRHITMHYKEAHPDHEVLISRLSLLEAEKAKLDAKTAGGDELIREKNQILGTMKRNMKALLNRSAPRNCRMCRATNIEGMNDFATHVSAHTGEFRFRCPAGDCTMQFFSRQDIKFHILTKHTKNRNEFYGKIAEQYQLTIVGNQLLGFLCSVCNFVQLNRKNVEEHISRQHESSKTVKIVRINMSESRSGKGKKKPKSAKNGTKSEEARNDEEESEVSDDNGRRTTKRKLPPEEESSVEGRTSEEINVKKMKLSLEDDNESQSNESVDMQKTKKLEENPAVEGSIPKEEDGKPVGKEMETNAEGNDSSRDDTVSQEASCNDMDMEDCIDLKSISTIKGSDIIDSLENAEGREAPARIDPENIGDCVKLKVGPLEAQLFKNSGVLYECYVKGCLFSTRLSNLFERHIEISHIRTKWSGMCEICAERGDSKPLPKKPARLVTALRHLKLHEREEINGGRLSPEDLILRAKLLSRSDSTGDEEESESLENKADDAGEVKQEENSQQNTENADNTFPAKPLLRVRNFLGDRLSTPKASDDGGKANEEETPTTDTSKMFTIENVRSLKKTPSEEPELKIEQVCSLKDQLPKSAAQLGPGKTIIVRSCPTRKIAIRPEMGAVAVDGGHINVVQPPVVGHPVVLSPLSGSSPIRIISASLTPKPKFTVKPIMVPADSVRFGSAHGMPVIRPAVPSALKTLIPVSTTAEIVPAKPNEANATSTQTVSGPSVHVDLYSPQPDSGSPSTPTTSAHIAANASDMEDPEEKDTIIPQKMPSSLGSGKKSLKDVKIYQEMLTKTKLCHFFKCMGIECSFTCDDENVFMQHIGLHEVQRRMNRNKGVKTIYLRMANRMTRAFYWQQCAYCCEVLNNSISALSQHIREEHGHCMYQCAFCFYRAVSHSYVKLHQNLAHSQLLKTAPRLIYKCKPLKPAPTLSAALEKHGRRQSVRPYHCDQCGMKFFITEDFITHLASEHQSVTAYTCHICKNLCFKINRLINHYKLHSYSTYQCPYCIHGTETEKEMVFHLCNFHFSQPAVMYVRALAEGQSDDEKQKPSKKKQKPLSNQLDSLKVIVYESDNLNLDCIVEVDPEDNTGSNPETSSDLNSIAAELGITTEAESSTQAVTPLMKELASIGEKGAKNITVKTLLPNAQFSSEGEKGTENCSVLISSGLSIPTDQNEEREMSIPLGQLPLEAVNVQHKEPAPPPPPPPNVESPDRNLKLNELIVNLQQKEKTLALAHGTDEDKIIKPSTVILSSAVHKLPPVVLTRNSSKNLYPSKCVVMKRKPEEPPPKPESDVVRVYQILTPEGKDKGGNGQDKGKGESSTESNVSKMSATQTEGEGSQTSDHPLITNVVSLSSCEFGKEDKSLPMDTPIVISDVCSLSDKGGNEKDSSDSSGVVINIKSKVNPPSVLRPPIIRVEDFPIEESTSGPLNKEKETAPESKEAPKQPEEPKGSQESRPPSPDIIILEEEKTKSIVTVTLDSDDEKDENGKKKENGTKDREETSTGNETIRKEMELLRKQIANETDSLLLDEPEAAKPSQNLTLNITPKENADSEEKTLLSPIEEAICSLNKKLQSETEQAQKKEEEEKKEKDEKKAEEAESKGQERRRTRFGARERKREAPESDGDEGSKKEDPGRKRFKEELTGRALFVCGNEKCTFTAEDDSLLKDHLFVCDLSRESSVLVCPHCSRQIKQFHAYLEHLKYHGEKKFHCGLCSFSSAVDQGASRHVKQKHKCSMIKVLPKESQGGHYVYYPKNYKVEKIDFDVNGYSPGDEDKLPLQSVYQVNVKCAKCPYFTKVRSNMVRHLKIHVKSVETEGVVVVPSTAPTNPVPCLETKERMFDKMTNLAASSQLAQAKEKAAVESLSPEEEAKLPQFVPEQMRYKCCLPDCNYITVDDGMLKHHIKALHDEISYYSCPHCQNTVHTDVRHVTLDKIGFHLKHHDAKLYKCAHCIFFHYQKNVVEKHTADKHPERRYFLHTVREPKAETVAEEEPQNVEMGARVWKCGLCDSFQTPSKPTVMDHLIKTHNTKSKYKCGMCSLKGNSHQVFMGHFASKHPGEKVSYVKVYFSEMVPTNSLETHSGNSSGADSSNEHFDTTPLWQRGAPRVRHIRGILIEEEEIKTKKTKRTSVEESEGEMSDTSKVKENAFYCPLCTNKKKPFYTRSEKFFRTHLYQELNYQQFACILCGKMFVDRKDFERHHSRVHPDKEQVLKQTKEDHEIKFWVDQVIAKRRQEMEERKRKLSDGEDGESQGPPKKLKEV